MTSNNQYPPTPGTQRRLSEDLAQQAQSEPYIDPGTPTPMPNNQQPNNEMDEIRQLVVQQQAQMAQQQAQMTQLQLNLQQALANQQQQQPMNAGNDLALQLAQVLQTNQSNIDPKEKEENRLVKLSETHWRKYTPLQGRSNFAEWKNNMLVDADYLNARDVLVGNRKNYPNGELQQFSWNVCDRLLHTRILDRLSPEVFKTIQTSRIQNPSQILHRLEALYGLSKAEERLLLVKTMMNLTPQGNPLAMMRQWQQIGLTLMDKQYAAGDIYHDIGIVLLGDWQRGFVRTQLDDLFAMSKDNEAHVLDMSMLIDQLESRYTTPPGSYIPTNYSIYRQEPRLPHREDSRSTGKRGSMDSRTASPRSGTNQSAINQPTNQQPTCTHCNRGTHTLEDCWIIHPEKRPRRPFTPYHRRDDLNNNNTGAANLVNDSMHSSYGWIFDTGASWTISNDKSAFINFIPTNHDATVDLPDGNIHHVAGIGTTHLPIGNDSIELKNVQYIPGLKAQLLSFDQLEQQGFDIQLTKEKPYRFQIGRAHV